MRHTSKPVLALALGLAAIVVAALLPAGLDGGRVPPASWICWSAILAAALLVLKIAEHDLGKTLRSLGWLLPPVLLLTLPIVFFAAAESRGMIALALIVRAMAAAGAAVATVTILGPTGILAGLRSLHVPERLLEATHAMLVALTGIVRQVRGMLRARAARRPSSAPWASLARSPLETSKGFGRLIGALLLRSVERAEALERARRARGVDG